MTKPSNTRAIEAATNKSWDEWVNLLNKAGAKDLAHRQIADLAYAELKDDLDNAGWWSQSVAVAYEQHTGRRQPGQKPDGSFEVSVTRTMPGTMDEVTKAWTKYASQQKTFAGAAAAKPPTTSQTDKQHHWGCALADGTRLNADTYFTKSGKVSLALTHVKLTSQTAAEQKQAYWKTVINSL